MKLKSKSALKPNTTSNETKFSQRTNQKAQLAVTAYSILLNIKANTSTTAKVIYYSIPALAYYPPISSKSAMQAQL